MTYKEWKKKYVDSPAKQSETSQQSFIQKKEIIYQNEQKIEQLNDEKKAQEAKSINASSTEEMTEVQAKTSNIKQATESLKAKNVKLQESLGTPVNAKGRFYDQTVDVSSLPQDVREKKELDNAVNHLFGTTDWKKSEYNVDWKVIKDLGFVSTNPDLHGGFGGNIQMCIDVPKGAKGLYIGDLSAAPDEKEFLLQCGTSFSVKKIDIKYNKWNEAQYDIYMTVKVGE